MMIPPQIDVVAIVKDLKQWGWLDSKIEIACGLGQGYIAQVRCGNIKTPAYDKGARLYNFWFTEDQDRQASRDLQTRRESSATA